MESCCLGTAWTRWCARGGCGKTPELLRREAQQVRTWEIEIPPGSSGLVEPAAASLPALFLLHSHVVIRRTLERPSRVDGALDSGTHRFSRPARSGHEPPPVVERHADWGRVAGNAAASPVRLLLHGPLADAGRGRARSAAQRHARGSGMGALLRARRPYAGSVARSGGRRRGATTDPERAIPGALERGPSRRIVMCGDGGRRFGQFRIAGTTGGAYAAPVLVRASLHPGTSQSWPKRRWQAGRSGCSRSRERPCRWHRPYRRGAARGPCRD